MGTGGAPALSWQARWQLFAGALLLNAMLGWSMHLFRIRGIRLEVHFTCFFLLAVVAVYGWVDAGWAGVLWGCATLAAFFTCIVLHELGHSFTGMHFGVRVPRILLTPIGGMAEFDEIPRQPLREVLMTLAGPAVNFVIVGLMWWVPFPSWSDADTGILDLYSWHGLLMQVRVLNLVMGCFNLFIPAFPMDGGRIVRALLVTRLPYVRATFWAAMVGKVIASVGIAVALAAPWLNLDDEPIYTLAVLFFFIFLAGEAEYRAVKRREIDEAHWRAVIEQRRQALAAAVAEAPPPVVP